MKIVLDTNVFVSAVFFGGVPGRIAMAQARNLPPIEADPIVGSAPVRRITDSKVTKHDPPAITC